MQYKKTILENGIRLITVPMPNNPTVTVSVTANVGAKYETKENNGISHFLEHLHFKGTKNRTTKDITLELDTLGASYNAFTNYEATCYYAKANKKYFKNILDVISDIYLNTDIPEEELEKERGVILEEINMYEDNNKAKAHHLFRKVLYGDAPDGDLVLGTKENIKKFTREDFLKFRDKFYTGESTTIVVSGDFKHSEVKKEIESIFKNLKKGKFSKPPKTKITQKKPKIEAEYKKTDQTHMVLGFHTFDTYSKDVYILGALRGILSAGMSSRLFSKMREELGICYYCYAVNSYTFDNGYMGIYSGVGNKRVEEALKGILEILNDIKENGVTKSELDKVKKNVIGKMSMDLETSEDFADFYADQEVMKEDIVTPSQAVKKIKSVTPEQIQQMARRIFKDDKMNLAIVGPHKNPEALMRILKLD